MITLTRFCSCEEQGTFGKLHLPTGEFLYTVEKQWRDNKQFVSCVPPGLYDLVPFNSPRFGETFALRGDTVGVAQDEGKQRYACLFHAGNKAIEVQGCIAPGLHLGAQSMDWAVFSSKAALAKLLAMLAAHPDERQLRIEQWAY